MKTAFTILLVVSVIFTFQNFTAPDSGTAEDSKRADSSYVPCLPAIPFNYSNVPVPAHYDTNAFPPQLPFQIPASAHDNTPPGNPVSDDGATLGRVLFYDVNLSLNHTISCASCHSQDLGFSDVGQTSMGFLGGNTRRHSMGLANAKYYQRGHFFWDERAASLEDQVLMPFQDSVEMGLTIPVLLERVREKSYYEPLFTNAFGDTSVTANRISLALSQFVRSMVSYTSKYDIGRAMVNNPMDPFPNFTPAENQGKNLFILPGPGRPSCLGCHGTEAFVNPAAGPRNNGLDSISVDDQGAFETFGNPLLLGAFKVPSLKNISVRPPYMHDGRFSTLGEVVDHYSTGIKNHPNLHPLLIDSSGNPVQYNFSINEKNNLIAFMNTLTDLDFLQDVKFSDPFCPDVTSTGQEISAIEFHIYPNPVQDFFTIKLTGQNTAYYEVFNIQGQKLLEGEIRDGASVISISDIAAGILFIHIYSGDRNSSAKLIKL